MIIYCYSASIRRHRDRSLALLPFTFPVNIPNLLLVYGIHCILKYEPVHEISNNVVCATSKGSEQPAHSRSQIRAFASRLSIL